MGLFGGCGNNGSDSWIWVLIIIVLIFSCFDNGNSFLGGCNDNNGCC